MKLKLNEDVEIQEKEAYISRELGAILINYESTKYYETNDTGTFIIKLLQEPRTIEQMVSAIIEEYKVDQETAQKDLDEFIEKLQQHKLLEH